MSDQILYVAPLMREWKNLEMELLGIPWTTDLARIKAPDGMPGVLLVFNSLEELQRMYPEVSEE